MLLSVWVPFSACLALSPDFCCIRYFVLFCNLSYLSMMQKALQFKARDQALESGQDCYNPENKDLHSSNLF